MRPAANLATSGAAASPESEPVDVPAAAVAVGPPSPAVVSPSQAARPSPTSSEMLEVEAHVALDVEDVHASAASIRQLAKAHGGQVTGDSIESETTAHGSFTIRVPSAQTDAFLDELARVGAVRSRQVTSTDVGRQYHDAQIVLENLTITMRRYEEILAKASTVEEVLRIEQELSRLRTEIDRVKGELRFLADRVSRATIYVALSSTRADSYVETAPAAKLYPGVHVASFFDFRGDEGTDAYAGAGVSFRRARGFSLDLDGFRRMGTSESAGGGLDVLTATIGGEFFSDFLGGGKRRFFNPFLGFFAGYARVRTSNEGAIGATLGVELYKSTLVGIDASVRTYGLVGGSIVHASAEPSLGLNIAF